ncbi:MAG: T9SS type A sorting domain-containing protein [Saprospiraceae bacterium]|nr:T9SS type A sorting domain-containing protein [Saprospiraceae bacterium]MBK7811037.1 T9SS type A sorting domain-containing protein [Saprospiraceae bacterium]MBK9630640.1 T9SS type A sorting domain-containing protein [Saprospiraceae bacterium]
MKYPYLALLFYIVFTFFTNNIRAQLYDNTWMMGCCYDPNHRITGGVNLRFDRGFVDTFYLPRKISFDQTAMYISNPKSGDLLFYSNGCHIYNKLDQIMEGGELINPGYPRYKYCEEFMEFGYFMPRGGTILPWPQKQNEYALIHRAYSDKLSGDSVDHLYFSHIDMNFNNGLGKVRQKNVILYDKYMYKRHFGVVRHANGRDWWIMTYDVKSDTSLSFLLSPEGFSGPFKQYFPIPRSNIDFYVNSSISPDGNIVARIDPNVGLFLMDIDRTSGMLSNLRKFDFWLNPDIVVVANLTFSPDSKLIYVNSRNYLYQLYLNIDDPLSSLSLIDSFDGFRDPFSVSFYLSQNSLDGRIYYNATNGVRYLHYINNPNEKGIECNFKQRGLKLPAQNTFTMPYFPNYRLGPIDGSESDTLGIDNVPWAWWRYDQDTANYRCFEFMDLSGYLTEESVPEWYWDLGDGTQSRDTSPIHCFEKDGIYEVCLIVRNKYGSDTLCRTLNVGTSATNDEGKIIIKTDIFPNPASDHFVLNVQDYLPERMYLHLINAQGQTVLRERIYQGSNVIDTEQLPAGLYSVVIYERGAVVKTEKIIVLRD